MKTRSFLMVFCLVLSHAYAQDIKRKFSSGICTCFEKIKLRALTTSVAVEREMTLCFTTSIMNHQEALKKAKVIDFETASDEDMTAFWGSVFTNCQDVAKAAYARVEELQNEEAAGSFQGAILYVQRIQISSAFKKMGITEENMMDDLKKKGSWADTLYSFHRRGDYARIGNNKEQYQKIYIADDNTIYIFSVMGNGICSVQEAVDLDLNGAPDKPTIMELDSAATIMGVPCKIMRMKWKISQIDYYYNDAHSQVNPDLFSRHSSEGLAEFTKRTKCLPLQIVTNTMGMTVIQTAVAVRPGQVDTDMFGVPELVEDESLNLVKLPGIKMMRIKE
jgi:hypothetical protein